MRARCRALEAALAPSADAAELAAIRPGGADNPYRGLDGYVEWYGGLRMLAGLPVGGETREPSADSDRVIEAARANVPVAVRTADGETRHVYAKAYDTLRFMDGLDRALREVVTAAEPYPDTMRVQVLAGFIESRYVRTWCWIITDPRPELPFAEDDVDATPPEWTRTLLGSDLVALWNAHHQVNGTDIQRIAALFPPPSRAAAGHFTLGSFLGGLAHEWSVRVSEIMRRWPLRELFAQAVDAARANAAAREAAKPGTG